MGCQMGVAMATILRVIDRNLNYQVATHEAFLLSETLIEVFLTRLIYVFSNINLQMTLLNVER